MLFYAGLHAREASILLPDELQPRLSVHSFYCVTKSSPDVQVGDCVLLLLISSRIAGPLPLAEPILAAELM